MQRNFGRYRTAVQAIAGDQVEHLMWRLRNGALPTKRQVGACCCCACSAGWLLSTGGRRSPMPFSRHCAAAVCASERPAAAPTPPQPKVVVLLIGINDMSNLLGTVPGPATVEQKAVSVAPVVASR